MVRQLFLRRFFCGVNAGWKSSEVTGTWTVSGMFPSLAASGPATLTRALPIEYLTFTALAVSPPCVFHSEVVSGVIERSF